MSNRQNKEASATIFTLSDLAKVADYSLLDTLNRDPDATESGNDHRSRQVFSGHYVPVNPTPIADPVYVSHSHAFFQELGLDDSLAQSEGFAQLFSGNMQDVPDPIRKLGGDRLRAVHFWQRVYRQLSI